MLQIFETTLSLMVPPVCPVCRQNLIDPSRELICRDCFNTLSLYFVDGGRAKQAGMVPVYFSMIYSDTVKQIIKLFKFENFESIGRFLARAMMNRLEEEGVNFQSITYIPSHLSRIREKGSYPTRFLARELSKISGKPVRYLLKATRHRESQTAAYDRQENVRDAFEVVDKSHRNETILIVDDVITSGATMAEAGRILNEAGYEKMVGIAAAGKP